jgi:chaperonin GroES
MTDLPRPLGDRVLVDVTRTETLTTSGLIIPRTTADDAPWLGTVLAVGPGRLSEPMTAALLADHDIDPWMRMPMDVHPGDIVLVSRYGGTEFTFEGRAYVVVSSSEILVALSEAGTDDEA